MADPRAGSSDYAAITERNIQDLGRKRSSRKSQVSMYADTAHFVYELLQNADDKGATEIHFDVRDDCLIVEHNGAMFLPRDVEAISTFGEGNPDKTKIGHFGLGFKSVFAYTAAPEIHSGVENFVLRELYCLEPATRPDDLPVNRTRFVLPFNHLSTKPDYLDRRDWKTPETARDEIAEKLSHLTAQTVLFTASLAEIRWRAGDSHGHYIRESSSLDHKVREVYLLDDTDSEDVYLVFRRDISWADEEDEAGIPVQRRPVEIAFQLTERLADGGRVVPMKSPPLFVFFPTEKSAGVRFIVQGPYRTTPARDNVPAADPFNQHLVQASAELLLDALRWLRDRELLTLDVLTALPLERPAGGFAPIHDAVRQALLSEPFLPAADGGYVEAASAKLARGAALVDLLSSGQLARLFGNATLRWIHPDLTADRYKDLHEFLAGKPAGTYGWPPKTTGLVEDIEIEAADVARRLDSAFMAEQSDEWVVRLYSYLAEGPWRDFRRRPIIRLANGTHVVPFLRDNEPAAFLPPQGGGVDAELVGFPFVRETLLESAEARTFLAVVLKLAPPDPCDIVIQKVLPEFPPATLSLDRWRALFPLIRAAMQTVTGEKREELIRTLAVRKVLLARKVSEPETLVFIAPRSAYFENTATSTFFATGAAWLLPPGEYDESDAALLRQLGVADQPRVHFHDIDMNGNVILQQEKWGKHRRGLNRFDPEWNIDGLEEVLAMRSTEASRLLWMYLLQRSSYELIRGTVQRSSRQDYPPSHTKQEQVEAPAGRLLRTSTWLTDGSGAWHRPADASLDALPEGFERDSERARALARQLGMALPQHDAVLQAVFANDSRKREIFDVLVNADDDVVKEFYKFVQAKKKIEPPATTFRESVLSMHRRQRAAATAPEHEPGEVRNPTRYAGKLEAELRESQDREHAPARVQIFRLAPPNAAARDFLYEQYRGACQISGTTFLKSDGKNYFEAVSLASRVGADHLNHAGNMLCLSAEMAARMMHGAFEWIDELAEKIAAFKVAAEGGEISHRQARVRITGEEYVITWSEQHFLRLVTLWNHA